MMVSRADLLAQPEHRLRGSLHGLAANKIIMQYLARSVRRAGLARLRSRSSRSRPFPRPFHPGTRRKSCAGSLVRGLAARGMIVPDRTILAGHSMGGAIALRALRTSSVPRA